MMGNRRCVMRRAALVAGILASVSAAAAAPAVATAQTVPDTTFTTTAAATTGMVSVTGAGIPGLLAACVSTSWSYSSLGTLVVQVNLDGTLYPPDFVTMTMSVSGCENANGGGGAITGGSISGSPLLDSDGLTCSLTGGSYTRQGVVFSATVSASCSIHGVTATPTTFGVTTSWAPVSTNGQGVTAPIEQAQMTGVLDSIPG
jgi:hypothetical protein